MLNFKNRKEFFESKLFKIIRAVLVFTGYFFKDLFAVIPIALFNIEEIGNKENIMLSAFTSLMYAIVIVIVYRKDLKREFKLFKENFSKNMDVGIKWYLIGLIGMMIGNSIILGLTKGSGPANENAVQSMIEALPWIMLFNTAIMAPIVEEIVFRKTIKEIFPPKVFIIVSAFVFGAVHVIFSYSSVVDLLYIIPYGALGFAFAKTYKETDTIFVPMTLHFLHNTILTLISILT